MECGERRGVAMKTSCQRRAPAEPRHSLLPSSRASHCGFLPPPTRATPASQASCTITPSFPAYCSHSHTALRIRTASPSQTEHFCIQANPLPKNSFDTFLPVLLYHFPPPHHLRFGYVDLTHAKVSFFTTCSNLAHIHDRKGIQSLAMLVCW